MAARRARTEEDVRARARARQQRQRVEIVIPARTLLQLLAFGLLVVLAILSLGTLLSIFLAAVLALGLDPVVERARAARLEARAARRSWCSRRCSSPSFVARARHRRAGVGADRRVRPGAAGATGTS